MKTKMILMVKGEIDGKNQETLYVEVELPKAPMSLHEFNYYVSKMGEGIAQQLALKGRIEK